MISGERSKYLQETIITQRNGRFVVPVKAEHRGDVPGLVHDTSSTGATVFVEPQQVVEINNQIKVLEGREEAEIERILASLSAEVSMYKGAIEQDYDALTTLDFIFARAKLSFEMNAAAPSLLESGSRVRLLRARHPLLDKDKAVAIDIAIGDDYDTLVITGPNTGGKTVSLKTLGLLSLMAASGLHIPASEESEIGLFEHVYADIGDEQSIEQSLSTFSAHMKTIVSIMDCCGQGDLVLFDELGAGTDPVEGAGRRGHRLRPSDGRVRRRDHALRRAQDLRPHDRRGGERLVRVRRTVAPADLPPAHRHPRQVQRLRHRGASRPSADHYRPREGAGFDRGCTL